MQAKVSSPFLLLTILPLTILLLTILLLTILLLTNLLLITFEICHFTINHYFQFVNLIDEMINQIYNDYKPFPEIIGVFAPISGVNYSVIREINFRVWKDFDSGSGRYFDGIFHDQFCF